MSKLTEHYRQLLGLDTSWEVSDVSLFLEEKRVEITLVHRGGPVTCPDCDAGCAIADHAPERTWRHLDTMQFETVLRAQTPRTKCKTCGVKTATVPWAGKHSRFTLMFEAFAIEVLQACGNVKSVAELIGLDWNSVHRIMERAVERGLACRELDSLQYAGIDEKSFRSGHSYVSILTDLTGRRVLEVVEDRWIDFDALKDQELKTSRAWAIKEQFRWFWEYRYAGNARKFFNRWYGWATRSQLKPIIKVAKMLKRHLENTLTYFRHGITNAMSEGFNSRIQSIKSQARGFRAFENYRTRILFYCGKLKLMPTEIGH